jgi:endonuclease/exonuclease/phosphatase family metal-dependent hydrolase
VATLNLWGRRGPWPERLPLIREEIRRLSPRLVGMQEVVRDGVCQASEIADGLGYEVLYAPATVFDDGEFGNALLTDLPIVDSQVIPLPTAPGIEPRVVLYALVAAPGGGELPVFVTHLDWQFDHGPARLGQVRFIVDQAARLAPGLAPVIMGDFNAEPHTEEVRALAEAGFTDAWTGGGDGSEGATFSTDNGYARRVVGRSLRIDYIFTRAEPRHTEVAFRTPRADVWPSDHFGLVCDLAL